MSDPCENIGRCSGFLHWRSCARGSSNWEIINDWLDIPVLGIILGVRLLLGGPCRDGLGSGVTLDDIGWSLELDSLFIGLHGSWQVSFGIVAVDMGEVISR